MKYRIKCISNGTDEFPNKLKSLVKCPEQIYVLGNIDVLNEFSFGVIGSRNCSFLGKEIARNITEELSKLNVPIVSGFARGIDTVAHQVCVEMRRKTIAVLGGGHEKIYPAENSYLIDKILENGGAVISEYPPTYPSLPNNFRERNRIIAALSDGVILIEARRNSGSLITINCAKNLGKKIFVIPGAVNDEMYEGSNNVLADGAFCIRSAKDVLNKYDKFKNCNIKESLKRNIILDDDLKEIYDNLSVYPLSLEEICFKLKKEPNKILSRLTMLEMQGFIKQVERHRFVKILK